MTGVQTCALRSRKLFLLGLAAAIFELFAGAAGAFVIWLRSHSFSPPSKRMGALNIILIF